MVVSALEQCPVFPLDHSFLVRCSCNSKLLTYTLIVKEHVELGREVFPCDWSVDMQLMGRLNWASIDLQKFLK